MNSTHHIRRSSIEVLALAGLASALVAPVVHAVDCSRPAGLEERRGCEKAAEGIVELQRFAERTRAVHNLYIPDFEKALPAKDLAQTKPESDEVATVITGNRQSAEMPLAASAAR